MLRLALAAIVMIAAMLSAASAESPRELGEVRWNRDFASAVLSAQASGKPLFALFQEVPGCATCVGFGDTVLSEPLFVEAIESEFVPVAIFNNKPGADAAILERFGEPAWNNPVVRFLGADGVDLIPRREGLWTPYELGPRMIAALRAAGREVPAYLDLAVRQTHLRSSGIATFAMPCYWRGEACLGEIDAVLATRAGWLGGREVVEVRFDTTSSDYASLLRAVAKTGCADAVFAHGDIQRKDAQSIFGAAVFDADGQARDAGDDDQKYYLRRSALRDLELGALQATRINAAIAGGTDSGRWLSPRQRRR